MQEGPQIKRVIYRMTEPSRGDAIVNPIHGFSCSRNTGLGPSQEISKEVSKTEGSA